MQRGLTFAQLGRASTLPAYGWVGVAVIELVEIGPSEADASCGRCPSCGKVGMAGRLLATLAQKDPQQ